MYWLYTLLHVSAILGYLNSVIFQNNAKLQSHSCKTCSESAKSGIKVFEVILLPNLAETISGNILATLKLPFLARNG